MKSSRCWAVAPVPVGSRDAQTLLRDYYTEVGNRWYQLHCGRSATAAEIEEGLAGEWTADLAPPTGVFLVAWYEGAPVGCAGLRRRAAGVAELTKVYVRPSHRGKGGGALLLERAEEEAVRLRAQRIVLDTRRDLVEAGALYARHGFVAVPAFSSGPDAEVWYGKEVRSAWPVA